MDNRVIGFGIIGVTGSVAVGGLIYWQVAEEFGIPPVSGPIALALGVGTVGGVRLAAKSSAARRRRRELEAAQREWRGFLSHFPSRLGRALEKLNDPGAAQQMWANLGMGTEYGWPELEPWPWRPQEWGGPDYYGIDWLPAGARIRLKVPDAIAGRVTGKHFAAQAKAIALALDVPEVVMMKEDGNQIILDIKVINPLADVIPVPLLPPRTQVDLDSITVGRIEDGAPYQLMIRGSHFLLAGLTGAGKSSAVWSVIAGLAPAIAAGLVELDVIDLKGGYEMSAGFRMFESFAWTPLMAIETLEAKVDRMRARAAAGRTESMLTGKPARKHIPTPGDPHYVLIIDEVLALLKTPGKLKTVDRDGNKVLVIDYASELLIELLSQARVLGITVLMATQNAAKEVMDLLRDLFTDLIGMRLASVQQQAMVFGPGAEERGVRATEITRGEAGTVYVVQETGGPAIRARFFMVEDTDIIALTATYGRDRPIPAEPEERQAPARKPAASSTTTAGAGANVFNLPARGGEVAAEPVVCGYSACDVVLEQTAGGQRRQYCSDKHRVYAKRERDREAERA